MTTIRIATRASALALAQAAELGNFLKTEGISPEIVPIRTTGDRVLDRPLQAIGGKGLFVRELELALREGRADVAVHSCKDLPADLPPDLPLLGCSRREDPRDALVLPAGAPAWDRSRPVGTCSRRRALQLRALYPDADAAPARGNVETRLAKLDRGDYGALVLAAAGLRRLGLSGRISRYFSPAELVPAAGQGVLAIQGRAGFDLPALGRFFDEGAMTVVRAERAFVAALGGGCASPVGAYAQVEGAALRLRGFFGDEARGLCRSGVLTGPADAPEDLGRRLAARLRQEAGI